MSEHQQVAVLFALLLGTIAFAVPIPIAVAIAAIAGFYFADLPLVALAQAMYTGLEPLPLMTVPLFVFAGSLMERGGLADRIVGVARSLIGNYTGSLGLVAILGCTFFAALSGSGPATTAAIGAVMVPAMLKERYNPAFGGAIVASGGALGSLIPPSNLMVVYGLVSDTSIPRLFLAGVIPGLIASSLLMLTTWIMARSMGLERQHGAVQLVGLRPRGVRREVGARRAGRYSGRNLCGHHSRRRKPLPSPSSMLLSSASSFTAS